MHAPIITAFIPTSKSIGKEIPKKSAVVDASRMNPLLRHSTKQPASATEIEE